MNVCLAFLLLFCSTAVLPYLRTSRTSLQVLHWEVLKAEWQSIISILQIREYLNQPYYSHQKMYKALK